VILTPDEQWLRNGYRACLAYHRKEARRARSRGTRHVDPYGDHSRNIAALHDRCAGVWQVAIDELELKAEQRQERADRLREEQAHCDHINAGWPASDPMEDA